jgi:alanine racemase
VTGDEQLTARWRATRAEIDLDAARGNLARLRQVIGEQVGVIAVVKADAYGHGAVPMARALGAAPGVISLAVSLVEEGVELRDAGIVGEILILGPTPRGAPAEVLARGLTPVISDLADLRAYDSAARLAGRRARVHVKLDSGMSRLGVQTAAASRLAAAAAGCAHVEIVGVCSHLACADSPGVAGDAAVEQQLAAFDVGLAELAAHEVAPPLVHLANSAAAVRFPDARRAAVRPGILLYGGGPDARALGLEPVMRMVSQIAQLRTIQAGEAVSYGWQFRAERPSRIATVPIGYADGYPRRANVAAGGRTAQALVRGRRVPLAGHVCMDMIMLDVTDLGEAVAVDDEVVLLGRQDGGRVELAELAGWAGLIDYEIVCGVSKRVPRVYKGAP